MNTTLLIDGDVLAFDGSFAGQEIIQWDEELWTTHGDSAKGKTHISNRISKIQEVIKPDETIIAFTHTTNFRKVINPDYKANRKGQFRPLLLNPLKDWMKETWKSECWELLEADDVLSILATEIQDKDNKTVIASIDKDFHGVPSDWYNYRKDELYNHKELDSERFHLIQTIAGDAVDGYSGIPKFGPKTAEKHLDRFGYHWDTVVRLYESKGLTEADALMNAWMARLLRKDEYNTKEKRIETLWFPDTFSEDDKQKYLPVVHSLTKTNDAF